jgi:hypothetical protein
MSADRIRSQPVLNRTSEMPLSSVQKSILINVLIGASLLALVAICSGSEV